MILAVRGGGRRGGMVHAATVESADPLDFSSLCGVTFNSVYKDGDERALFVDFLAGEYGDLHICPACTELVKAHGE